MGVLVGVLVFLGLSILGVKYALLLAILSGLFEIIPVFGPIISAVPAIGIAFTQKPILGLSVLIPYSIVQQFENHLIYPLVVRKTIGIPPLLVIISIFIGGTLAGFFGILLAVPMATVFVDLELVLLSCSLSIFFLIESSRFGIMHDFISDPL